MIEYLRKAASSWVAKLLLGLLVISFAAWGVGDMLRSGAGDVVAEVGEEEITVGEFRRAFDQTMQRFGGRLDPETARQMGIEQLVLSDLAARAALMAEARELGVDAPDEEVIEFIRGAPAFQTAGGEFQKDLYDLFLSGERMRKVEFEEMVREDLARSLIVRAVGAGGAQPVAAAEAIWRWRNETRDARYFLLEGAALDAVEEPTEAALEAYHAAESDRFTAPEYRDVSLLWIRAEDRADPSVVTDAEARELFEARRGEFNRAERRNLLQIIYDTEQEAIEAAAQVADGGAFARLAAERGLSSDEIALGYVTEADLARFQPEIAAAAFAEDAGAETSGVVGPVRGSQGWALLRIDGVDPGETVTFEEVADQLKRDIAADLARGDLAELANAVEDLRAAGALLDEVAEKEGIPLRRLRIDSQGLDPEGALVPDLPSRVDTLARAFELEIGEEMILETLPNGEYYALEVTDVTPPALRPLAEVRADVERAWRAEAQSRAVEEAAEAIVTRLQAGEDMAVIAAEYGAGVQRAEGLRRDGAHIDLPQELIAELFEAEIGDAGAAETAAVLTIGAQAGPRRAIARLEAVTAADPTGARDEISALAAQSAASVSQDMLSLFQAEIVDSRGFVQYPAAVDFALNPGGAYGHSGM